MRECRRLQQRRLVAVHILVVMKAAGEGQPMTGGVRHDTIDPTTRPDQALPDPTRQKSGVRVECRTLTIGL